MNQQKREFMMGKAKFISALVISALSSMTFADDISGVWKILMIKQAHQKRF
jgi:hypothetical protein